MTDNSQLDDAGHAFAAYRSGDWSRARTAFASLVEANEPAAGELLEALAVCCFQLGSPADACKTFERAFVAFVNEGKTRRAAAVAAQLVGIHELFGAEAAVRGWEQRALRLIEDIGPCIEHGYLLLARTGCEIHDPIELEERADLALRLAREFGSRDLELRARADKGLALVGQGRVSAGFALLDEAMVAIVSGELQDEILRGKSACAMLSACERTGDIGRAEYWCRRIEEVPNLQHVLVATHCRITYGAVEALRGRWEEAEARLSDALRADHAAAYHRVESAARLAEMRIQQGRHQEAADLLKGYEDRFEAIPALARLRIAEGHYGQAAGLLRSAVRSLGGDRIRLAPVLALAVEVNILRDDRAAAERAAQKLRSLDEGCESNEIRAYARLGAGRVARYGGNFSAAIDGLETALTLLIHYDRPLLSAEVRLELARALAAAGDEASAIVEAQAALATFHRLGVVPGANAATALLQMLAAEADRLEPAQSPATDENLTPRESEVAALVAQGLTNREIAERLVVSVRTVEGHIDRILGKLDFHTRTQLAMWVGAPARM